MYSVNVLTMVFGTSGAESPLPPVDFEVQAQTLTAHDIIAHAVAAQVEALLASRGKDAAQIERQLRRQYLAADDIAAQARKGKIAMERPRRQQQGIHIDDEIRHALNAFERGAYKVFVDGEELVGLDQTCRVSDKTSVKFVRLIPLVGG